jgi:hypothetical protein
MSAPVASLDEHWHELVTAALLGTERRSPPEPPVALVADVVADAVAPDDAARMLATVAAVTAARRAAFVPLAAADRLQSPPDDPRPVTPPRASDTWRTIVAEWPVLEDEWMLAVIERGYRLAPDVLVAALDRHRRDPVRRARAALAGGTRGAWVTANIPELAPIGAGTVPADAVATLPELAIAPELSDPNLLARCRPAVLVDAAEALAVIGTVLSLPLVELCRLRYAMLTELDTGLAYTAS